MKIISRRHLVLQVEAEGDDLLDCLVKLLVLVAGVGLRSSSPEHPIARPVLRQGRFSSGSNIVPSPPREREGVPGHMQERGVAPGHMEERGGSPGYMHDEGGSPRHMQDRGRAPGHMYKGGGEYLGTCKIGREHLGTFIS